MAKRASLFAAAALTLSLAGLAGAADVPRKAPFLSIRMPEGKSIVLSDYRGKVVAMCFILTTCPHCQKTVGLLNQMQAEFGPRGFQALASAIEQGSAFAVPAFVRNFAVQFPVGFNDPQIAIDFMQHPPAAIPLMPMIALVDREGYIREQHEGNDSAFFNDQQEANLRKSIESLLSPAAAKKSSPRRQSAGQKTN